ncbi:MAG: serine/threonine-protein phosphatase [Actinomycetota bacterium]|nr:serine/threonine-protein phosphatase [Actinomycetota bacterium]
MPDELVARLLLTLDARLPFALMDAVSEHLHTAVGASAARLWLADYQGRWLQLFSGGGDGHAQQSVPVDSGGPGLALRRQQTMAESDGPTTVIHLPVTVRSERLGVLEVVLSSQPAPDQRFQLEATAVALGYVILASSRYTDVFQVARRRRELELPAEMQWALLPALAHDGPVFTIAGSLEPAYDIGGDNFDYTVEPRGVTVSLTDAMGHGAPAALLSTLAVSAHRNARRQGHSLRQQARAANVAVHDRFGGEAFATGLFVAVERDSGQTAVVNAGHPPGYVLREGSVTTLPVPADVPLGLFRDAEFTAHPFELLPGDRVLLVSDGILEAAPDRGEQFGQRRLVEQLLATTGRPPADVVGLLTAAVLEHRVAYLVDDATAVCVDYRRAGRAVGMA